MKRPGRKMSTIVVEMLQSLEGPVLPRMKLRKHMMSTEAHSREHQ